MRQIISFHCTKQAVIVGRVKENGKISNMIITVIQKTKKCGYES
jgi:hypothetical protein